MCHSCPVTSRGRGHVAAAMATLIMGSLGACAAPDDSGARLLTWYVDDAASYAAMARTCADASGGEYRIELVEAPDDPAERRTDLIQRLRTGAGPDLIGLDTSLVAELASSDLLEPVPAAVADDLSDGRTPESLDAVTHDGALIAAPWWYEPFVLFHRGSVAERAGLDVSSAVTWNELSAGAARVGGTVQIAGTMTEWVGALVAGGGGSLVGEGPEIGLNGAGSTAAATAVRTYAASGVGPGPSAQAAASFASSGGAFLVAPVSEVSSTELAPVASELKIAAYPRTAAGTSAPAPLVGTSLAVAAGTDDPGAAFEAVACLTGAEAQRSLVATTGHVPTLTEVLESPSTGETLTRLDIVTEALAEGVAEPRTPDAHLLRLAIDSTWLPLSGVGAETPARSAAAATRLLDGGLA